MMNHVLNQRDLDFILYDVLGVETLTKYERYSDHSRETFNRALETAQQIAESQFAPHNRKSDLNEPRLVNGRVEMIPEIEIALRTYADAGFFAAHHNYDRGGMQLPWAVAQACACWFYGANVATSAYAFLTIAAANLLDVFGSEEQKARYLPPMLDGRFFGTMALSEPQAGSSLADIATTAEPCGAGLYRIRGSKMWISAAAHELSQNIINLVLARIKGAPAGVKGLSLFIVPRRRVSAAGNLDIDNNISVVGLNHKMGYRGTTNTVLAFGETGDCIGELIGVPNQGIAYMFHMMNEARIVVALSSSMLGYAGFRYSLDYARNRQQGRLPDSKDPLAPPVPIIRHADVRRMLLKQKAYVEGGLALGLYSALLVDQQKNDPSTKVREDSALLLEFLTPILKAWSSDYSLVANNLAIQVLGGYGYTRDYPVEQYWRDNRLNPIHEGTNGIQAIDLLGRKVVMADGKALQLFIDQARATVFEAARDGKLKAYADELGAALDRVSMVTTRLLAARERVGAERMLANAADYLELVGHTVIAWIWLWQATTASRLLPEASAEAADFYRGKMQACQYYFRRELPKTCLFVPLLGDLDPTCLEMKASWF